MKHYRLVSVQLSCQFSLSVHARSRKLRNVQCFEYKSLTMGLLKTLDKKEIVRDTANDFDYVKT